ncbi:alanine racemase [Synergistales bacterium]|nr:alanine racemase [Synergistales bacterium]
MNCYPKLVVYLDRIRENAAKIAEFCHSHGAESVAVTKVTCADVYITRAVVEGMRSAGSGKAAFADSRVLNLEKLKKEFPDVPRTLLRVPMKSELERVVLCADSSLVSMVESVYMIEECCSKSSVNHDVILMLDLGDRREGVYDEAELPAFIEAFKRSPHVKLCGVGSNFACFAGVMPSAESLNVLCRIRALLERALSYPVPIASGGSTSSLIMFELGNIPEGINQLRIGEGFYLGLDVVNNRAVPWLRQDTLRLEAEVVEVKVKPSLPSGEQGLNAFGEKREFKDEGFQKRVIFAVGRQDVTIDNLTPGDSDIHIIGGSSDHMIATVPIERDVQWGDIFSFSMNYAALLPLTTSLYVSKEYR